MTCRGSIRLANSGVVTANGVEGRVVLAFESSRAGLVLSADGP